MKTILFSILLLFSDNSRAFPSDSINTAKVESVITQLFDAIRTGNADLAQMVFHETARLMSVSETQDGTITHEEKIEIFLETIASPHDEVWDERISGLVIQIDGPLAQVWMNYEFYVDDLFRHCGVNSMQLVYHDTGWKIIQIADTRRKEECN